MKSNFTPSSSTCASTWITSVFRRSDGFAAALGPVLFWSLSPKIFQMALPAEVKPDSSAAQRSQTTGHLVLSMPRAGGEIKVRRTVPRPPRGCQDGRSSSSHHNTRRNNVPEWLEVDPSKHTTLDLANIVPRRSANQGPLEASRTTPPASTGHASFSEGFVDDPDSLH
ncbi:hypothetical protein INR49_020158 [Caranx melampygus]|nr:hypothetical protein INR49_020158 [Caranx melampygus]